MKCHCCGGNYKSIGNNSFKCVDCNHMYVNYNGDGLEYHKNEYRSKNFGTSLNVISHGGDIQVNSTMAGIGIKASDELILEADKIILKANKIQIGDQFSHGTKEITLNATRIQVDGKKGNLPNHLKLSWGSAISFGPGGFVGQSVADKFFSR